MVFSSSLFLLFFLPLFFMGYFLVPYRFKNWWALIGSTAFYAWGAPVFVFVLFGSITADFLLAKRFSTSSRRAWFILGILLNVGLLAYFKYANFFVDNVNALFTSSGVGAWQWTKVALPIGISFFTFQKISYLVDVYRGVRAPLKRFQDHALYVVLFPQLIAGPIVRFNEISEELEDRRDKINADNRLLGVFRFALGLGKKVLIANVLGEEADRIFGMDMSGLRANEAWYGVLCYTFQIYFDFSGYSDMAIGLGRMMGFTFPENFKNPYISGSITEFWRRWHITLSTWMRDYLYIPLGGNKVSSTRLYFNLWIVFLISGLWHGAAWTFVAWGAYHGGLLVLERLFLLRWYERMPRLLRTSLIFVLVMIGWVFFRADNFSIAWEVIESMFSFSEWRFGFPDGVGLPARTGLLAALLISFVALIPGLESKQEAFLVTPPGWRKATFLAVFSIVVLAVCAGVISASGFNPFIYFRF